MEVVLALQLPLLVHAIPANAKAMVTVMMLAILPLQ